MEKIEITKSDLEKLKIIGRGTEGTIYQYSNDELIKIYHSHSDYNQGKRQNIIVDESGVNITPIKKVQKTNIKDQTIQYFDTEGVRLAREDAIIKAIEAQKNIYLTKLPQKAVYLDGKIRGCSLYYHKHATNIYNVMHIPVYKWRLKIVKEILKEVKELADHNIYHIDLCQHPTKENKNTNILLMRDFHPEIIDIDGHSAIYSETPSECYERSTTLSLSVLVIELLSREYITDFLRNPEDIDLHELVSGKIPEALIDDFLNEKLTLEKINKHLS